MSHRDWSRQEVESLVDDYVAMLKLELAGMPYNKAAHRRALKQRLDGRSDSSIEFKHANISAALLDAGFPHIIGYKCRENYQALIAEVIAERLAVDDELAGLAAADAERPIVVPEVDDILAILTERPVDTANRPRVCQPRTMPLVTNYIEREAHNRSLGTAGELFVLNYERARLIHEGRERLAGKIEHTSRVRGDHEGFDVLSFDADGRERLIEVKTTKYSIDTPFFVTRNEVAVSERRAALYQVYRLFEFRDRPRLYTLHGAVSDSCRLQPATFLAMPN